MQLPFVSRNALDSLQSKHGELVQEYQNYRRRNASIQQDSYQKGADDAVRAMLPVYDNLQRALEQPCQDEAFLTGVRMTLSSLERALEGLGVTEIPALDQPFDPSLHEAMEHIEDPEKPENTVIRVVRAGFIRDGVVIRHALVAVAN